jgi:hypothetical protein
MSDRSQAPIAASRTLVFAAISALEEGVDLWLTTPAAWDQRTHPSIRQFLRDIREYVSALQRGGRVSPNIIYAAAERLATRINHPHIDELVHALRQSLAAYVRELNS